MTDENDQRRRKPDKIEIDGRLSLQKLCPTRAPGSAAKSYSI